MRKHGCAKKGIIFEKKKGIIFEKMKGIIFEKMIDK